MNQIDPLKFFAALRWIDGRPLIETIEAYRRQLFTQALFTFDADGRPRINRVLSGRSKKNYKSSDLCLAGLYCFLCRTSPQGNDAYVLANDEDQAGDDLGLLKKLIAVNPILANEVDVLQKAIVRKDGRGTFRVLPARDVAGAHGKTACFIGYDEIWNYRTYDLFEALAPDPTRPDVLEWITSYAGIYSSPGFPLHDLFQSGKRGDDPRMLFSWYAGDFTTDPEFEECEPEARANPSMASWANADYLGQQRRRLPTHKFRRLHLNLPGMPDGAALNAERVMACVIEGRKHLAPHPERNYSAFVDMSGGSSDDAVLAIAHWENERAVLDLLLNQGSRPPFNPRVAVSAFVDTLKQYGVSSIHGDAYAGRTFKCDFEDRGIIYRLCEWNRSQLYSQIEPALNSGQAELLDHPKMLEQFLGLVRRGEKVDHEPNSHDDFCNAAAGALVMASQVHTGPGIYVFD